MARYATWLVTRTFSVRQPRAWVLVTLCDGGTSTPRPNIAALSVFNTTSSPYALKSCLTLRSTANNHIHGAGNCPPRQWSPSWSPAQNAQHCDMHASTTFACVILKRQYKKRQMVRRLPTHRPSGPFLRPILPAALQISACRRS